MKMSKNSNKTVSPPPNFCLIWTAVWLRRGGRDLKKISRSLLVGSGRGGWFKRPIIGGLNQPPRLRELMWLREIFLIAQPPLLIEGGEFALSAIVPPLGNSP